MTVAEFAYRIGQSKEWVRNQGITEPVTIEQAAEKLHKARVWFKKFIFEPKPLPDDPVVKSLYLKYLKQHSRFQDDISKYVLGKLIND